MVLLKRFFFLATALHITLAVKPPNYIEKPKVPDKYPPKYEYNYFIANRHTQAAQGHKEIRIGDNTRGNYFVNLPKGESKTTVNYIADEWGFHPVARYSSRGPHHRASGHFALGLHAVERLNETNLNTNEVFINQYPGHQQAPPQYQQQAQATFPAAQIAFHPKTPHQVIDNQAPLGNIYAPNQPHHEQHQQQFVFPSPGALYNQQVPSYRNQEKPLIFQHAQPIPLIYQYAQQQAPPHINYFYQHKPQEVIYHQQPIASMAGLQQQQQQHQQEQPLQYEQQQFVVDESQQLLPLAAPEAVDSHNGNINVALPQEIYSQQEISLPPVDDGVNGNLLQVQPEAAANNVATVNQQRAQVASIDEEAHFQSPIVVGERQIAFNPNGENQTIIVQQKPNQGPVVFQPSQPPQKQFNIQILTDANAASSSNEGQFLKEASVAPKVVNGHTNSNNFQYLVDDDQDFKDSTPSAMTEAPSRQFLKKFKNFRTYEHSTTSQTFSTSTSRTVSKSTSDGGCCNNNANANCCKNKSELVITQRPIANSFLAPVHAGIRLTNEKLDDCLDGHTVAPPVVEVHKTVNVVEHVPAYGDRLIVSTPATFIEQPQPTKIIHQPIIVDRPVIKEVQVSVEKPVYIKSPPKIVDRPVYIKSPPITKIVEKIVHQPVEVEKIVEKIVDRPYYIKSPPETKVVHQQVFIEKPVIKEVQVPVEKTVYVKSPPETKIVHQPVIQTVEKPVYIEKIVKQPYEVERIVEKFVDRPVFQTVEKPVYIEKFIDRPVEKIVDRPVIQTVEKIVEKPVIQTVETPVYIEKIVDRPVDRPYPVPYAVGIPYEKHIFHKPDFHVIAKAAPHKHKLFDFEGLFGFLGKKKEVKHIYVPSSQQHQLKQLGHHQLIQSTLTTIDPVKESPILDYTRYATTHLNPIKPVYGVPSTPLQQVPNGYHYPNPYANYAYDHQNAASIATIPSSWLSDSDAQHSHIASVPRDNYVGPTPLSEDYWAINGVSTKEGIKFRRNVENGRSLRIEYGGFHPKMSPSVEIDENGTPLKKEEN